MTVLFGSSRASPPSPVIPSDGRTACHGEVHSTKPEVEGSPEATPAAIAGTTAEWRAWHPLMAPAELAVCSRLIANRMVEKTVRIVACSETPIRDSVKGDSS